MSDEERAFSNYLRSVDAVRDLVESATDEEKIKIIRRYLGDLYIENDKKIKEKMLQE